MRPFRYEHAADPESAVRAVARDPGATFLGGGTNLVDLMKLDVAAADTLVDVRTATAPRIEQRDDGGLRIASSVTNTDLAADPHVRDAYPVLSEAVLAGASGQLRNIATTGGNLLQRTRCPYFQDVTTPCNKRDPGSGCSARHGYQRDLAVLGTSESCLATHPSDMAVALTALDAEVRVTGADGERVVPVARLHRLPGDEPQYDTVLEHGELITAVDVPPLDFAARSRYRKARDRASYAFALVSVAAALDVADGRVRGVRIALGGVAPKPWRASTAEAELLGSRAEPEQFAAAADAELAAARPVPGNRFKLALARNLISATLTDIAGEQR